MSSDKQSKNAAKKQARLQRTRESKQAGGFGGWRRRSQNASRRAGEGPGPGPASLRCTGALTELGGGQFMGQDKWLGGALGDDGCVYGMPGSSKHVLKVVPGTGETSLIGGPFEGRLKWLRGGVVDGQIFGIPANADSVLRIVPRTGQVDTIGGPFEGKWKWHGGVVVPSGVLYGIPANATRVLKVTPSTGEVELVGPELPGDQKWYGGLLGGDGKVYGMPMNATSVLRIDPGTDTVDTIGELPSGGFKWHGGVRDRWPAGLARRQVVGPDGNIYAIPSHADSVLKVMPSTGQVKLIGGPLRGNWGIRAGKYKYLGGVLGSDGKIYGMPANAEAVLQIDPATESVALVGGPFEGENKWQNGYLAPDGAVYGIPLRAEGVLRIAPGPSGGVEVGTIGGPLEGTDKWEGGVEGPDGALYCIPLRAKSVLKIAPHLQPPAQQETEVAEPEAQQWVRPPPPPMVRPPPLGWWRGARTGPFGVAGHHNHFRRPLGLGPPWYLAPMPGIKY